MSFPSSSSVDRSVDSLPFPTSSSSPSVAAGPTSMTHPSAALHANGSSGAWTRAPLSQQQQQAQQVAAALAALASLPSITATTTTASSAAPAAALDNHSIVDHLPRFTPSVSSSAIAGRGGVATGPPMNYRPAFSPSPPPIGHSNSSIAMANTNINRGSGINSTNYGRNSPLYQPSSSIRQPSPSSPSSSFFSFLLPYAPSFLFLRARDRPVVLSKLRLFLLVLVLLLLLSPVLFFLFSPDGEQNEQLNASSADEALREEVFRLNANDKTKREKQNARKGRNAQLTPQEIARLNRDVNADEDEYDATTNIGNNNSPDTTFQTDSSFRTDSSPPPALITVLQTNGRALDPSAVARADAQALKQQQEHQEQRAAAAEATPPPFVPPTSVYTPPAVKAAEQEAKLNPPVVQLTPVSATIPTPPSTPPPTPLPPIPALRPSLFSPLSSPTSPYSPPAFDKWSHRESDSELEARKAHEKEVELLAQAYRIERRKEEQHSWEKREREQQQRGPAETLGEEKYWKDSFASPSSYKVRVQDLFPSPHQPQPAGGGRGEEAHDSTGQAFWLMGRYSSDPSVAAVDDDDPLLSARKLAAYWTFRYRVCSFENVCLHASQPENLFFHFKNLTTYLHHAHVLSRCNGNKNAGRWEKWDRNDEEYTICSCFHRQFQPLLRDYEYDVSDKSDLIQALMKISRNPSDADTRHDIDSIAAEDQMPQKGAKRMYPNPMAHLASAYHKRDHSHYWGIQKWVHSHHIAHFAQKLFMFQSIMQHAPVFYHPTIKSARASGRAHPQSKTLLPALSGIVFQDSDSSTNSHEESILHISLQAAVGQYSRAAVEEMMQAKYFSASSTESSSSSEPTLPSPSDASGLASLRARHSKAYSKLVPPFVDRSSWFSGSSSLIWSEDLRANRFSTSRKPRRKGEAESVSKEEGERMQQVWHKAQRVARLGKKGSPPLNHSDFTCFKRFSFAPQYGELALHEKDTERWRAMMSDYFSAISEMDLQRRAPLLRSLPPPPPDHTPQRSHALRSPPSHSCPPRRISMLHREDRRILNYAVAMRRIAERFNLTWNDPGDLNERARQKVAFADDGHETDEFVGYLPQLQYVNIDGASSTLDQYRLFSSTGLLLSPHSSQLINVIFSPLHGSIVEITPEFYNIDFLRYAVATGHHSYFYLLGGGEFQALSQINSGKIGVNPAMDRCVTELNNRCAGEGECVSTHSIDPSLCLSYADITNKRLSFSITDWALFDRIVDKAIAKIELQCEGKWISGFEMEREERRKKEEARKNKQLHAQEKKQTDHEDDPPMSQKKNKKKKQH